MSKKAKKNKFLDLFAAERKVQSKIRKELNNTKIQLENLQKKYDLLLLEKEKKTQRKIRVVLEYK